MKVLLTILGLLNKGNLYGYDIKKKINENSVGYNLEFDVVLTLRMIVD